MACLNMLNNEQHQGGLGPRISFSSDFVDPKLSIKLESSYREAPVSSDFDFSVPTYTMISADELFFKGKMLPLKENCAKTTTLRDELLSGDDDFDDKFPRFAKGPGRWRERFGLKRSPVGLKKSDNKTLEGALERIDEMKRRDMVFEDVFGNFKGERQLPFLKKK